MKLILEKLICLPGKSTADARSELIELRKRFKVNRVLIHTGTNSVPHDSPQKISDELISLAREIKAHMPSTKCFISAILPKTHHTMLPGINIINRRVCDASNNLDFKFVQHRSFCHRGRFDDRLFASDFIHLSHFGVRRLGNDIKFCLNQ